MNPSEARADPRSEYWSLGRRPGFLIRRLHQIHVSLFMAACSTFEITPLQYSILSALADLVSADQTTLAAVVALDRTTTTDIIKRLHARRLVSRSRSRHDRRAQVCGLTSEGLALLLDMEGSVRRAHQDTIKPLTSEEQEVLLDLMGRIVGEHAGEPDDLSQPVAMKKKRRMLRL